MVSWNVKSLIHPVKCNKVFAHLKNLKTDIAFLQVTHLRFSDHCQLKSKWVGQTFHSNFKSKARGVAIILSKNIQFVVTNVEADAAGRFLIVVGHLYGLPVILANIYAPNWDDHLSVIFSPKKQQLWIVVHLELFQYLNQHIRSRIFLKQLMFGDFVTLRPGPTPFSPQYMTPRIDFFYRHKPSVISHKM